jgi:hypothetical protein
MVSSCAWRAIGRANAQEILVPMIGTGTGLICDKETGIGRGGRLADGVAAFTGTLATQIVQLRPRDPKSKGIVERRNGYFETSFMPGMDYCRARLWQELFENIV